MTFATAIAKLLPWPGLCRRRAPMADVRGITLYAPGGRYQRIEAGTYEVGQLRRMLETWEQRHG